ncbi:MAG TPA: hypothetical protein VME69_04345 [Methylocella sp.]|nr:hypothetical protein [Methylocella sp.]
MRLGRQTFVRRPACMMPERTTRLWRGKRIGSLDLDFDLRDLTQLKDALRELSQKAYCRQVPGQDRVYLFKMNLCPHALSPT